MKTTQLELLENNTQMGWLLDFYGGLLTKKQQEILSLYFEEDYSLTEIGEMLNVSRQNVYDMVYRASNNLKNYEQKLNLVERTLSAHNSLKKAKDILANIKDNDKQVLVLEQTINTAIKQFEGE